MRAFIQQVVNYLAILIVCAVITLITAWYVVEFCFKHSCPRVF